MDRTPLLTGIDAEVVSAIAHLAPNAIITIQVRASDLARAFQDVKGGPAELTPGQAAKRFGRSAPYWRTKAAAGAIKGAYLDPETERWRLPNVGCREHLAAKARGDTPGRRFVRRGPRKARRPAE
jgi:hypothetical protein